MLVHPEHKKSEVKKETPVRTQSAFTKTPSIDLDKKAAPVSHYAENILPIGSITWRKRAQVQGRVNSIKSAPSNASPSVEVEVWDETGGITLNFLGRREIAGLEVGMEMRAEGMVGEEEGQLTILNPSYELLV